MSITKIGPEYDQLVYRNHSLQLFLEQLGKNAVGVSTDKRFNLPNGGVSAIFFDIPVDTVREICEGIIVRNEVRIEQLRKVIDVAEAAMRDFDTTE